MSDSYLSSNIDDLNPNTPSNSESIGVAAKAIRQIKSCLVSKETGGLKDFTQEVAREVSKEVSREVLNSNYKVGDIFITLNDENPSDRFGGTWEPIKDCFLVGASDKYPLNTEGGEESHTLTVDEIPSHKHLTMTGESEGWGEGINGYLKYDEKVMAGKMDSDNNIRYYTSNEGGGKPHNNIPPYLAVHIWKKVSD